MQTGAAVLDTPEVLGAAGADASLWSSVADAPSSVVSTDDEDERAMRQAQAGDAEGLEALYDRHHRAAMALAYRILGDRALAEDAVQESFLSAWRRAASYNPTRGNPRRWLLSIVHHRCIDRLRRVAVGGPLAELDETLMDSHTPDVFQAAFQSLQREQVRAALAMIPAEQREAIELAYFAGYTQQEIAVLQHVPLGTAKGRVRIGLQKLRTILEPAALLD